MASEQNLDDLAQQLDSAAYDPASRGDDLGPSCAVALTARGESRGSGLVPARSHPVH